MRRHVPFREPIGVALETLRAHKMRSFLTLLGIILSVSTLIVVIALIPVSTVILRKGLPTWDPMYFY